MRKDLEGVFVQIGLVLNSRFMEGVIELSQYGVIVIDERDQTSKSGIIPVVM